MLNKPATVVQNAFCLTLISNFQRIQQSGSDSILKKDMLEIQRFFIGMSILESIVLHDSDTPYPQVELNQTLRQLLGNGNTWHSSLNYLTGVRAKTVYAKYADVFKSMAGARFMEFASGVMADIDLNGMVALNSRRVGV